MCEGRRKTGDGGDVPHSRPSAQNQVGGGDESVQMEWPRLRCSWHGCLRTHHLSKEELPVKTMTMKTFWGKHLVDLIPRFPCAGSSAACNRAVHAESLRTELLLCDMGEPQFVKLRCGLQSGMRENTQGPLKSCLKQFVSFSGNVKGTPFKISITTLKSSVGILSSACPHACFPYALTHDLGTLLHLLFLSFPLSVLVWSQNVIQHLENIEK